MSWRERLALWCLRVLTPNGLGESGLPLVWSMDSGLSTPDNPKLVIRFDTVSGQRIISVVAEPNRALENMREAVDGLREWAARQ